MSEGRPRQPLYTPERPAAPAVPWRDNPAPQVLAMIRRIWETSMRDLDFVNHALEVDIAGFRQYRGDWVGAVVSPWFVNLYVLPGGGALWQDRGSGERVRVPFPVGELEFIADYAPDAEVPAYLYCPLLAPVNHLQSQAEALQVAIEALSTLFSPPALEATPEAAESPTVPPLAANEAEAEQADPNPENVRKLDRRGFFRRLAGR